MNEYLADIQKYDPQPDSQAITKLASDLRLIMQDPDARYVATSDAQELSLIVKNFAIGKLDASSKAAEEAVHDVAQLMSTTLKKNRVTFYYLVAKKLGQLSNLYS